MSRKTTLTSRPPPAAAASPQLPGDGPPLNTPGPIRTELAVVEAYTASERKVRLAHALSAGRPAASAHPPRKGRGVAPNYIKPEDADVRDVSRTCGRRRCMWGDPCRETRRRKAPTWPFAAPPAGIGLSLLYAPWKTSAVCAVSWACALELRFKVGFWAPLP